MYPTIEDGDTLLVNTKAMPEDGDILILDVSNMEGWNNSAIQIVKRYYAGYSAEGYYVIGDNADGSYDSRDVGKIDKERLIGVVQCNLSKDRVIDIVIEVFKGFFENRRTE